MKRSIESLLQQYAQRDGKTSDGGILLVSSGKMTSLSSITNPGANCSNCFNCGSCPTNPTGACSNNATCHSL